MPDKKTPTEEDFNYLISRSKRDYQKVVNQAYDAWDNATFFERFMNKIFPSMVLAGRPWFQGRRTKMREFELEQNKPPMSEVEFLLYELSNIPKEQRYK